MDNLVIWSHDTPDWLIPAGRKRGLVNAQYVPGHGKGIILGYSNIPSVGHCSCIGTSGQREYLSELVKTAKEEDHQWHWRG